MRINAVFSANVCGTMMASLSGYFSVITTICISLKGCSAVYCNRIEISWNCFSSICRYAKSGCFARCKYGF